MIRITYVTVTYNAAGVLQRTLDSVLQQDYPEIVHLIIDGASTDDTLRMVETYIERSNAAENGHRIQMMSEPDKGIYDAMNKGLRSLDGDYVCFLNAGDFLPASDTVSRIVAAVDDAQLPAVLYGDTDIVDGEGHFLHHRRLAPPEDLSWKSFRQGMLVCHQAFYARTDFAIATPYDTHYRYSADVDWCIRVMKAAAKENIASLWSTSDVLATLLVRRPFSCEINNPRQLAGINDYLIITFLLLIMYTPLSSPPSASLAFLAVRSSLPSRVYTLTSL